MAGIKRKEAPKAVVAQPSTLKKKQKLAGSGVAPKKSIKAPVESDGSEDDDEDMLDGEDMESDAGSSDTDEGSGSDLGGVALSGEAKNGKRDSTGEDGDKKIKSGTTSAEAHAAQRVLAKERRAAKPNADNIARSKKIWERLRRKSHVPREERKALVTELFEIITGRVRDFVFKHDSVRVIQCALKYANQEQRKNIVAELRTDVRPLSESKYGKFMVAKMVVEGDSEIRNMIVPEFYGHVRRLINHPEAAWIVDDIYRQVANAQQKALLLREWYGAEYALYGKTKASAVSSDEKVSADLSKILEESPEKKKTIMQYLQQIINQLVQKKMTGFTMLHDAMLQYFLNITPGSSEAGEFLELLKSDLDEEAGGDLLKNLAFTKSGSKVVSLALAYGTAKDRKLILRVYKDTIEMMAFDQNAHMVLLAAMDVIDDTKMTAKMIFPELLGENIKDEEERAQRLLSLTQHLTARIPLLYPTAGQAKWLLPESERAIVAEIHAVREITSKKDAEIRRTELVQYLSPYLLPLVESRAAELVTDAFGCQYVNEVLLECQGDKTTAAQAVAAAAAEGDPTSAEHLATNPAAGKMLRALVGGGKFDFESKTVKLAEPRLGFGNILLPQIKGKLLEWAVSPSSFVVVSLLESEDVEEKNKKIVREELKKHKKALEKAAKGEGQPIKTKEATDGEKSAENKKKKTVAPKGNAGAKILLEML